MMRTTLNIDDKLLAEAQRPGGVTEKAALVREGLRALIERESARRLVRLGGSEPQPFAFLVVLATKLSPHSLRRNAAALVFPVWIEFR